MNLDITKYLIGIVGGAVILLLLVLIFRREFSSFLLRLSKIRVVLPGGIRIDLRGDDAASIARDLLKEIETILTQHLTADEKRLFLEILRYPHPPTVLTALPTFNRDSPAELKMLRALRGVYFIRPVEGGRWQPDKHIQVTTLGEIVAKHRRELLEQNAKVIPATKVA